MTAHWGIEDPAAVEGDDQREAFMQALRYLQNRISLFLALPFASLDELAMRRKLREIGQSEGARVRAGAWEWPTRKLLSTLTYTQTLNLQPPTTAWPQPTKSTI